MLNYFLPFRKKEDTYDHLKTLLTITSTCTVKRNVAKTIKGLKRHTPIGGVSDNRPGVDKIRVHDDPTLRAVQRGHFDVIHHRVGPEEGPSQVVDGDALWTVQVCRQVTF